MSTVSLRTRMAILQRDGYRCVYCGRSSKETALQVDHVLPRARGGTNDRDNLVAACFACNNGKATDLVKPPDHAPPRIPQVMWTPVWSEDPSPFRCAGERHGGPYQEVPYDATAGGKAPPCFTWAPGTRLALVCRKCAHVVAWRHR